VKQGFYNGPASIPLEAARAASAGSAAGTGRIRIKAIAMHPFMVCAGGGFVCAGLSVCEKGGG
jgi:hypothetical protein